MLIPAGFSLWQSLEDASVAAANRILVLSSHSVMSQFLAYSPHQYSPPGPQTFPLIP